MPQRHQPRLGSIDCLAGSSSSKAGLPPSPESKPTGLCIKIVTSSSASKLAFLSNSMVWCANTRAPTDSMTWPSTRTQPPSMYCSAWLREQLACAARRLARRSPTFCSAMLACFVRSGRRSELFCDSFHWRANTATRQTLAVCHRGSGWANARLLLLCLLLQGQILV